MLKILKKTHKLNPTALDIVDNIEFNTNFVLKINELPSIFHQLYEDFLEINKKEIDFKFIDGIKVSDVLQMEFHENTKLSNFLSKQFLIHLFYFTKNNNTVKNRKKSKKPLSFLNVDNFLFLETRQYDILEKRVHEEQTLSDIGELKNRSKEAIRQTEKRFISTISYFFERIIYDTLKEEFDHKAVIFTKDIINDENDLKLLIFLINCWSKKNKDLFSLGSFSDKDYYLYQESRYKKLYLTEKLTEIIDKNPLKTTKDELINTLNDIGNINKEESEKIISCLSKDFLLEIETENGNYFIVRPTQKAEAILSYFIVNPEVNVHDQIDDILAFLKKYYPNYDHKTHTYKNIITIFNGNPETLLCERGTYIRADENKIDKSKLELAKEFIRRHFEQNETNCYNLHMYFENNKEEQGLVEAGYVSEYVIYEMLKREMPDDLTFLTATWIGRKGFEGQVTDEIKDFLIRNDGAETKAIMSVFGVSSVRAYQLLGQVNAQFDSQYKRFFI